MHLRGAADAEGPRGEVAEAGLGAQRARGGSGAPGGALGPGVLGATVMADSPYTIWKQMVHSFSTPQSLAKSILVYGGDL